VAHTGRGGRTKVGLSGEEWWKVGALAHGMLGGASGGSVPARGRAVPNRAERYIAETVEA